MKLYHVRHFNNSNDVHTISKHRSKQKAMIMAQKFIDNLEKRYQESGNPVIVERHSIQSKSTSLDIEMFSLCEAKTNHDGDHAPVGEGVSVSLLHEAYNKSLDPFDIY